MNFNKYGGIFIHIKAISEQGNHHGPVYGETYRECINNIIETVETETQENVDHKLSSQYYEETINALKKGETAGFSTDRASYDIKIINF